MRSLFTVIDSPMLLFSEKRELLYALWPREGGFRYCATCHKRSLGQIKSCQDLKTVAAEKNAPQYETSLLVSRRREVLRQAQEFIASWPETSGRFRQLDSCNELGGMWLDDGTFVVIGPITPLRVQTEEQEIVQDNHTALRAANMWLTWYSAGSQNQGAETITRLPESKGQGAWALSAANHPAAVAAPDVTVPQTSTAATRVVARASLERYSSTGLSVYSQAQMSGTQRIHSRALNSRTDADSTGFSTGAGFSTGMGAGNSANFVSVVNPGRGAGADSTGHVINFTAAGSVYDLPPEQRCQSIRELLSCHIDVSAAVEGLSDKDILDGSSRLEDFSEDDAFIAGLGLGKIGTVRKHNQVRNEMLMQQAITEGNVEKLHWSYLLPPKGRAGILGNTALRSWQNHAHLVNVLSSRAAIAAGVSPEEAYTLSDRLFLMVEAVGSPGLAKHMRWLIARAFAEQVHGYLQEKNKSGMVTGADEPALIRKARFLIHHKLFEPLTLKDLAQATGCTEVHLSRRFRQIHGLTVMDYVMQERIKIAKELLQESDCSVKEIASQLQFASASHFCRAFKQSEHLSPGRWRLQHSHVIEA